MVSRRKGAVFHRVTLYSMAHDGQLCSQVVSMGFGNTYSPNEKRAVLARQIKGSLKPPRVIPLSQNVVFSWVF